MHSPDPSCHRIASPNCPEPPADAWKLSDFNSSALKEWARLALRGLMKDENIRDVYGTQLAEAIRASSQQEQECGCIYAATISDSDNDPDGEIFNNYFASATEAAVGMVTQFAWCLMIDIDEGFIDETSISKDVKWSWKEGRLEIWYWRSEMQSSLVCAVRELRYQKVGKSE